MIEFRSTLIRSIIMLVVGIAINLIFENRYNAPEWTNWIAILGGLVSVVGGLSIFGFLILEMPLHKKYLNDKSRYYDLMKKSIDKSKNYIEFTDLFYESK